MIATASGMRGIKARYMCSIVAQSYMQQADSKRLRLEYLVKQAQLLKKMKQLAHLRELKSKSDMYSQKGGVLFAMRM